WILTGVRGVGKTTTARILARALNYELPDGSISGPTVAMPVEGVHCRAIMESRHLDVLEMDAASHRGIDDVRQITDSARYAPGLARYKVYILDEVHMLTEQAFNALLKTLEEPPAHLKFVFATTEIRKVPITVLSRCQRFDLRREETGVLMTHLAGIAERERITVEPEALASIARAAEGSVRDALSLLDQAIAHSGASVGHSSMDSGAAVRAEDVRQMLGLADRTRIIDLFEAVMRGDMAAALALVREQYDAGADPAVVLGALAEFTHFVTRVKIVPAVAEDVSFAEVERTRARGFAEKLSMRVLARAWQMLLKGVTEVEEAGRPLAAAEMVLVRMAYAADLPTPDDVIRLLDGTRTQPAGEGAAAHGSAARATPRADVPGVALSRIDGRGSAPRAPRSAGAQLAEEALARPDEAAAADSSAAFRATPPTPAITINRFDDLIALAAQKRDIAVKAALERDVRLVRCEDGRLEIALEPSAAKTLVNDLARKFSQWTNRRWMVVVSAAAGEPTVRAQLDARQSELKSGVRADPLVAAVLARFPGAEIVGVRTPAAELPMLSSGEPEGVLDLAEQDEPPEPPPVQDGSAYGADWRTENADDS
ncbi:MAG: polymerase subunit gamma/tau, partial [Alphaproteobacteria bacterium]|nr:polymerase subunit gamma/tau [Alphaproteobacteria bacterium]